VNWEDDILQEAAMFPKGKNGDIVDCMTQALLRSEATKRRSITFGRHTIVQVRLDSGFTDRVLKSE